MEENGKRTALNGIDVYAPCENERRTIWVFVFCTVKINIFPLSMALNQNSASHRTHTRTHTRTKKDGQIIFMNIEVALVPLASNRPQPTHYSLCNAHFSHFLIAAAPLLLADILHLSRFMSSYVLVYWARLIHTSNWSRRLFFLFDRIFFPVANNRLRWFIGIVFSSFLAQNCLFTHTHTIAFFFIDEERQSSMLVLRSFSSSCSCVWWIDFSVCRIHAFAAHKLRSINTTTWLDECMSFWSN